MIKKYITTIIESKYLFYSLLLFNIIFLCFTKFYPSMDGPAHLYNSNILLELLKGNETLAEYYTINKFYIPNWTSHFIILIFRFFLPAWIAEKLLIIIYVSGMALSFRYLITSLNPDNKFLSVLIFPFIYSFLFHLGFYNFCLSFILFFLTIGYWLRYYNSMKLINFIILFILLLTNYFSNILIFGFTGLTLGLYTLYFSYKEYIKNKELSIAIRFAFKKLSILLFASIPGLIFLLIFYSSVQFFPSEHSYSAKELLKWINDARPFIVYDYAGDKNITEHYFYILLIMLVLSFIPANNSKTNRNKFLNKGNIMLIPLLLTLLLLFISPDGSGAGMMSDRYCLMFFIFSLIYIGARPVRTKIVTVFIVIFMLLHIGLTFKHLNGAIKGMNRNAISISETDKHIKMNSIVLPVNFSDNFIENHFSNYIGINKPLIILENYEASVGWFPINWKLDKMPNILLSDKRSISGITWPSNPKSLTSKQIDYVLLYGNLDKINSPQWKELMDLLSTDFRLKFNSTDKYILLYERR